MKRIVCLLLGLLLLLGAGSVYGEEELLTQGSQGEAVVRVQERLFDLGYYTYKSTGSFQTVTRQAVVAYQLGSGFLSDGTIGLETKEALFSVSAKRAPFEARVPLTYRAQGAILRYGTPLEWEQVSSMLVVGNEYAVLNAATGERCLLSYLGGTNHAEMGFPRITMERNRAKKLLTDWLGSTNSLYKIAALLELNGQWVCASLQWDGVEHVCLYVNGSTSHVFGLPDAEHTSNISKTIYG